MDRHHECSYAGKGLRRLSDKLISLARQVMTSYNIVPVSIRLIESGGMKTVWKVETSKGPFCLKRLRSGLEKVHFSIQAQQFLMEKKANVPAIIKTKGGTPYVSKNGHIFVLYDWVIGKKPHFSQGRDLKKAIEGLAVFHKKSLGFRPKTACRESSKWSRWPSQYHSMLERFKSWKTSRRSPRLVHILQQHIDTVIGQGEKATQLLLKSNYPQWTGTKARKGLCHQDFSENNVLFTRDGAVVLDLDSVTYDVPARDLRKMILKEMVKEGKWDSALFKNIISWYTAVHPLTTEQLRVVYIDCLFPHLFHETAKKPFHKNEFLPASKLKLAIKIEKSKTNALLKLI
ncbi:spore coat protein I [Paenibacillus sp. GP183]|nr:spore coat protein I [Paenibacillus sp. GP183]